MFETYSQVFTFLYLIELQKKILLVFFTVNYQIPECKISIEFAFYFAQNITIMFIYAIWSCSRLKKKKDATLILNLVFVNRGVFCNIKKVLYLNISNLCKQTAHYFKSEHNSHFKNPQSNCQESNCSKEFKNMFRQN